GKDFGQVVREMLTAEGLGDVNGAANFLLRYEAKPEVLAGAVGKQLLGVTLQCAPCHDHPFAGWKRGESWGVAAFFVRTKMLERANEDGSTLTAVLETRKGELQIPDPAAPPPPEGQQRPMKTVPPRLPGAGGTPASGPRRAALAEWITS